MKYRDKITILMPCWNTDGRYLEEAIQSVFNQPCPYWELIIINDGPSTRLETIQVLEKYKKSEGVTIIGNEGKGEVAALNTGMKHVKTKFAMLLNSDDMIARNTIKVVLKNIKSYPAVDFFYSSMRFIDDCGRRISGVYWSRPQLCLNDFKKTKPVHHLLCWRMDKAREIGGFDEGLGSYGGICDYDFPWSMFEAGCIFRAIPDCLYIYRDHRSDFRLTTDIPAEDLAEVLRRILIKHRISPQDAEKIISSAKKTYLRQSYYEKRDDADKISVQKIFFRLKYKERHPLFDFFYQYVHVLLIRTTYTHGAI